MFGLNLNVMLYAGLGALLGEIFHWFHIKSALEDPTYERVMKSPIYWIISGLMILVTAITIAVLFPNSSVGNYLIIILGAGIPLIFKKAIVVFREHNLDYINDDKEEFNVVNEYFI